MLPAGADAARPPYGTYTCLYPPFSTPHPLKLIKKNGKTKYKVDGSSYSPYAYARNKINFKNGPYSDYYGRYETTEKRIVIYDKETDYRFWNCPKGRL